MSEVIRDDKDKLLDVTKSYLNVDFDDDNKLIDMLINGAREYLENAGVPMSRNDDFLYSLCVMTFVHYFYFDREKILEKSYSPFGAINNDQNFRNLVSQLVLSGDE